VEVPNGASLFAFDLEDRASIDAAGKIAPRYVVHNAALTEPTVCESDPDAARRTNVEATRALAEAVRDSCERFVYCSTDLVFGGTRPHAAETDSPSPLMVYGQTKLDGEAAARTVLGERVVVARLALLYGRGRGRASGRSFTEKMLADAERGHPVRLFTDQFRSPLYVGDAARGVESILGWRGAPGVVHLGGPERLSRFDMGVQAFEIFGLDRSLAVGVRCRDVPSRTARPLDVSLDIGRARSRGFDPRPVRDGLLAMREASDHVDSGTAPFDARQRERE
jgi:dTDP-4-dehydrorhamnose reductase